MSNAKEIHYFGKLRRRREFLKSASLSEELYNFWESWFSKCSRKNSFLPFLDSRNKSEYPSWLFIIKDEDHLKIGLTVLSSDMSERYFPFVIYYNVNKNFDDKEFLKAAVIYLAHRYDKFKKINSIGSFDSNDLDTFKSEEGNNELGSDLLTQLDNIIQQIIFEGDLSLITSYWVNLNTSSYLKHEGAFTCALYNKVYG